MHDLRPNPELGLEYSAERPIFSDFLQQAQQTPETMAVVSPGAQCSYRQLEAISRGLAGLLIEKGASASDRVVIVASRSAGLVYAMLGAMRGGLAFTVADAAYPAARVDQIIRTLEPAFVLLCGDADLDLQLETPVIRIPELPDAALQAFGGAVVDLPEVNPAHAAYITFTSGSTGEPKGVVTHHAPLVHFIEWHVRQHGFTRDDRFSLLSGLGHDPVYRDVFTPLSIGATVICPAQSSLIDPLALASWIQDERISAIHLTPPLGKLIETGAKLAGLTFDALRYFFWGGDALSQTLYQQIRLIAPNAASVNFYGTTETPQAMGFHRLDPHADNERIPLGRGIDGAQLLVVNESSQLAAEGEVGEILIRSPYLSLGYWNDPALTRDKFVPNPFTRIEQDICYKTGDLGAYRADGSVTFLGRGDSQVKIRGHRIELSEIEGVLARHPRIKQAVVLAQAEQSSQRLVAYCVASAEVSPLQLREHLGKALPDYMVPAQFVFIDKVPLTPNGKIDKRALPAMAQPQAASPASDEELSPLGLELVAAWSEILEVPNLDANLSFVELGGDSLSFVQASMVLEGLIGHLPDRWEMLPVRQLCGLTQKTRASIFSLRAMELPVLLRVISILFIVIGHLHVFAKWPIVGETKVLFIVSGIALARFQLQAIVERGNARTLGKSIAAIAVPTILYAMLVQVVFDKFHWQTLLLVSNWFPESVIGVFTYWYIEVLVQMIVLIGFALSFERVRKVIMANPFRHLVTAACLLAVMDLAISAWLFDASYLYNRVPQHYLAIMVLGMAIHYAHSGAQKWIVSAVAVIVMGGEDLLFLYQQGSVAREYIDIAVPGVLALIWVKSIAVPGLLSKGLALVASSTLFIYLTHFQFWSVAKRIAEQPVLGVVLAIVGGVCVAYAWNKGVRMLVLLWNRGKKKNDVDAMERVV
ncbi:amino acid adenylation domain-containing protein [Pseudomonas sp. MYb118]|uniref:amino acid adenylation domain-containing protein n=1 Tax=Pseudomonas sp. MYb118 TaxID=1848720 RepID=UPI0034CF6947